MAVVLVTGASSGVGRATALAASRRGHDVILAARDRAALDGVAQRCHDAASTLVVPTDVADDGSVRRCVDRTMATYERLDAVVNCAAVLALGRTEEIPAEVFDGVVRTTLLGPVNVTRHVFPVLRAQNHGTFVQIGSVVGHVGVPGMAPYVVSKWAVRALTRQLQMENLDRPGVHVSYVSLAGVDTPIYLNGGNYTGVPSRPPLPTTRPERVAEVVLGQLDRPRRSVQLGPFNRLMRVGFAMTPRLYDRLTAAAFALTRRLLGGSAEPTPGNVLSARATRHRIRGGQPTLGRSVAKELTQRFTRAGSR